MLVFLLDNKTKLCPHCFNISLSICKHLHYLSFFIRMHYQVWIFTSKFSKIVISNLHLLIALGCSHWHYSFIILINLSFVYFNFLHLIAGLRMVRWIIDKNISLRVGSDSCLFTNNLSFAFSSVLTPYVYRLVSLNRINLWFLSIWFFNYHHALISIWIDSRVIPITQCCLSLTSI
jgi:hypothetical protein